MCISLDHNCDPIKIYNYWKRSLMQILDQNWEGFLFSSEVKYCQIDIEPGQSAE